eukprot:scaffold1183_cov114-Cylindrotheca_fusiformis.AAC.6
MDSFSEWVNTADHPCFQEWGSLAVELGASWDSFRCEDKEATIQGMVKGGVPILAARDMTTIASKEILRSQAPMAIFWDLENMPIPTEITGRDIIRSLKSILAPFGDLVQFRGYASIGLNHIPQEKRSDLQLSGCHLVDCPHHGRKEVADKMIIVDAMQFAFQHPEAATLCLITGDSDYAYLLATLQRPQWRTIVISRGTMQSMLHVNCNMKIRWETDILQPICSGANESVLIDGDSDDDDHSESLGSNEIEEESFRPLSADESWMDDVELLRNVVKQEGQDRGIMNPLKSAIGGRLRNTNPARFSQRIEIKEFLAKAIEEGVVIEHGERQYKTLCLPIHSRQVSKLPSMPVMKSLPSSVDHFPPKVSETAKVRPFIVVIQKTQVPSGEDAPKKAFVQASTNHLFYMFASHKMACEIVSEHPWLGQGRLVDARQLESLTQPSNATPVNCSVCGIAVSSKDMLVSQGQYFCSVECQDSIRSSKAKLELGLKFLLKTLAGLDDRPVLEDILVQEVVNRHPTIFLSPTIARTYIAEAEKSKSLLVYDDDRRRCVTLPKNHSPGHSTFSSQRWKEDVELLHTVITQEGQKQGTTTPRKGPIGSALKSADPIRFAQRANIKRFLAKAIDEGVVIENGEGAYKTLCLSTHSSHGPPDPSPQISKHRSVCSACSSVISQKDHEYSPVNLNHVYCSGECLDWSQWSSDRIEKGSKLVIETLDFLARYDDVHVDQLEFVKLMSLRHATFFPSRRIAKACVLQAEKSGGIVIFNWKYNKGLSLPQNYPMLKEKNVKADDEVCYVRNLLEFSGNCVDRRIVNDRLKKEFPISMADTYRRRVVYTIGYEQELFFIAKGPWDQMVGLTPEDAKLALKKELAVERDSEPEPSGCDKVWDVENSAAGSSEDSSDYSSDDSSVQSNDGLDIAALIKQAEDMIQVLSSSE